MCRVSRWLAGGLVLFGCTPLLDPGERPENAAPVRPTVEAGPADAAADAWALDAGARDAATVDVDTGHDPIEDAAAPEDAAPAPPLDGGCAPFGAPLGPCAVCGVDGLPAPLPDDESCPIGCGPRFELNDGVCLRTDAVEAHRCRALGACHPDRASACTDGPPVEVARAEGPCERIVGCAGEMPPRREVLAGEPCNRFGLCGEDGACDVPPECALPGDLWLCGHGSVSGAPSCTVQGTDPDTPIDCVEVCGRGDGRCLAAQVWGPTICAPGLPVGCRQRAARLLCVCGFATE